MPEPDGSAAIHASHPFESQQMQCGTAGNADQRHIMGRTVLAAKSHIKQGTTANTATRLGGSNEKPQPNGDKGKDKRQNLRQYLRVVSENEDNESGDYGHQKKFAE